MRPIVFFVLALVLAGSAEAGTKEFVREYSYRASDDDSKNSARRASLEQLTVVLLREVGVYIESYLELDQSTGGAGGDREFIREEIKVTAAGVTKTVVLDEEWDGKTYYLKASIELDPEDVIRRINESLEERRSSREVERLNAILTDKEAEVSSKTRRVEALSQSLAKRDAQLRKAGAEVRSLEQRLRQAESGLAEASRKKREVEGKIAAIARRIKDTTVRARRGAVRGMTREEAISVLGQPRSRNAYGSKYNYGGVWLEFSSGLLRAICPSEHFRLTSSCSDPLPFYQ